MYLEEKVFTRTELQRPSHCILGHRSAALSGSLPLVVFSFLGTVAPTPQGSSSRWTSTRWASSVGSQSSGPASRTDVGTQALNWRCIRARLDPLLFIFGHPSIIDVLPSAECQAYGGLDKKSGFLFSRQLLSLSPLQGYRSPRPWSALAETRGRQSQRPQRSAASSLIIVGAADTALGLRQACSEEPLQHHQCALQLTSRVDSLRFIVSWEGCEWEKTQLCRPHHAIQGSGRIEPANPQKKKV